MHQKFDINKEHGCFTIDVGNNAKINFMEYSICKKLMTGVNYPFLAKMIDNKLWVQCPFCIKEDINPKKGKAYQYTLETRFKQMVRRSPSTNFSYAKSEKQREAVSKAKKGVPMPEYRKELISKTMLGHKQNKKTRKLKSEKKTAYWAKLRPQKIEACWNKYQVEQNPKKKLELKHHLIALENKMPADYQRKIPINK